MHDILNMNIFSFFYDCKSPKNNFNTLYVYFLLNIMKFEDSSTGNFGMNELANDLGGFFGGKDCVGWRFDLKR